MPKVKPEISDWFNCPDDPYNGRVEVRLPKPGEVDSIRERTREMAIGQDSPVMRMSGTRASVIVAAIKKWENFFDAEDQPMRCTDANIKIMCNEAGFMDFIDECLAELEARAKAKADAEVKN